MRRFTFATTREVLRAVQYLADLDDTLHLRFEDEGAEPEEGQGHGLGTPTTLVLTPAQLRPWSFTHVRFANRGRNPLPHEARHPTPDNRNNNNNINNNPIPPPPPPPIALSSRLLLRTLASFDRATAVTLEWADGPSWGVRLYQNVPARGVVRVCGLAGLLGWGPRVGVGAWGENAELDAVLVDIPDRVGFARLAHATGVVEGVELTQLRVAARADAATTEDGRPTAVLQFRVGALTTSLGLGRVAAAGTGAGQIETRALRGFARLLDGHVDGDGAGEKEWERQRERKRETAEQRRGGRFVEGGWNGKEGEKEASGDGERGAWLAIGFARGGLGVLRYHWVTSLGERRAELFFCCTE